MTIKTIEDFSEIHVVSISSDNKNLLIIGETHQDGLIGQTEMPVTAELLLAIIARDEIEKLTERNPALTLAAVIAKSIAPTKNNTFLKQL